MAPPYTVCIIGAGSQGLCALKNILEESDDGKFFVPTCFDSRDCVGGIWAYTKDTNVLTALETTLTNVSRYRNCYGDFPVEESDFDGDTLGQTTGKYLYLGQRGFLNYLERYAQAFDLQKWIQFNTKVVSIQREKDSLKWEVIIRRHQTGAVVREECLSFDKIIFATGQYHDAFTPPFDGVEAFAGPVIHSREYKKASEFDGKRVLIVGFSNTAGDISTDLVGHAESIHMSHRRGNRILQRMYRGKPLDLYANRYKLLIRDWLFIIAPVQGMAMFDKMATKMADECWSHKPEWNFRPTAPFAVTNPMISERLVPNLENGSLLMVPGVRRIFGKTSVELTDDSLLDVDAIICCTGYIGDGDLVPEVEFVAVPQAVQQDGNARIKRVPRLYQNIFPPNNADSLAFMNDWQVGTGICECADVMSMAIVQIWKGGYHLPDPAEMNRAVDLHLEWCRAITGLSMPDPRIVQEGSWRAFLNRAAGTNLSENLGYGLQGWKFWLIDREFCNLCMTGIDSPHLHRLFAGRRKKWPGARAAIEAANRDLGEKVKHNPKSLRDV